MCSDHAANLPSANPVTPGGKNNLPKRKTKRSTRKRNKTSSSFEAIAEGAEEEPLEQVVEETSRDLESLQTGIKPHMHSRNRSSSREREFSVLKLNASQLQDFKKLAAFEVLDVHVAAKSPHKDSNSSPRIAPQSPRYVESMQGPASMPLLPVALEPSPEDEMVGDDQPLVVVAAKRTKASSIRVLRLFERGGKGMFRSQSDSDLNGATPYSFNNPHYQQGQVAPSHAVTGAKVLVQQRSWNANAFQKYNEIKVKNAARMKGVNMNNTNVNNTANVVHVNGVAQSDAGDAQSNRPEVVALSDGLKNFTVQGKKDPRRRQSLPESLPLGAEDIVFMH